MPRKSGRGEQIVQYVQDNPGSRSGEIGAALGFTARNGMLTWLRKSGLIFAAGPRSWTRYYQTAQQAWENEAKVAAEAIAQREAKMKVTARRGNIRRMAKRHAAGAKPKATRTTDMLHIDLPPGATIAVGVKIQVAPKPRNRFDPDPGFERVITGDWVLRRQGVDVIGELRAAA